MTENGRDRLRELLDAVLDDDHADLRDMAAGAFSSPWHFSRQLSRGTGESPVALRRRVILERAAWRLSLGESVTDTAWAAGYDSVDGFSRAFTRAYGYPPSSVGSEREAPAVGHREPTTAGPTAGRARASTHWLPAPNGIHFHPPTNLWVSGGETAAPDALTAHLVRHDVDDTRHLLRLAADLDEAAYRRVRWPGLTVLSWDGPEESVATVLEHHIWTKEVWLASIEGRDFPERGPDDPASLTGRHADAAARWLDAVRDIERRGAWDDRLIDALCEPPESFVLSSVIAHVLTYAAHRRLLVRHLLRDAGVDPGEGDPIDWLRGPNPTPTEENR
ncbi:AraC family transcriptional regulator [Occultella glacieicola]|uniref:AraC family transcriptional regulator n=1 Tax=Occultella glacieicola TaxID=2518684 RepID=A0ABY2E845_9MICO|nr:helix-turn-helix domain-containing protein [Occultella glacieicola]TDE98673.1 AraC family transcriptional regulator [Occultella glacieicola]